MQTVKTNLKVYQDLHAAHSDEMKSIQDQAIINKRECLESMERRLESLKQLIEGNQV